MKQEGQLSLEYLLVLLSFFALLALVSPLVDQAYQTGLYGLSVKQGLVFASGMKSAVEQLSLFSSGSQKELQVNPVTPWRLQGRGASEKSSCLHQACRG